MVGRAGARGPRTSPDAPIATRNVIANYSLPQAQKPNSVMANYFCTGLPLTFAPCQGGGNISYNGSRRAAVGAAGPPSTSDTWR